MSSYWSRSLTKQTEVERKHLLSDDEIVSFIINGFHVLKIDLPDSFHQRIFDTFEALPENPGDQINVAVPELAEIWDGPQMRGALTSILGPSYELSRHMHCHKSPPNTRNQPWHQDERSDRDHQHRERVHTRSVLAMYYPQDVTHDMGPTAIIPASHRRIASPDSMVTYGTVRGQFMSIVPAGSVVINHYDVWHAATSNRSDKVRYMMKWMFERTKDTDSPPWTHDPANADEMRQRLEGEHPVPLSRNEYSRDHELRVEMWNSMAGPKAAMPKVYSAHLGGPWPKPGGATTASRMRRQ